MENRKEPELEHLFDKAFGELNFCENMRMIYYGLFIPSKRDRFLDLVMIHGFDGKEAYEEIHKE